MEKSHSRSVIDSSASARNIHARSNRRDEGITLKRTRMGKALVVITSSKTEAV